jgi:hypothetical protein
VGAAAAAATGGKGDNSSLDREVVVRFCRVIAVIVRHFDLTQNHFASPNSISICPSLRFDLCRFSCSRAVCELVF